MQIAYFHVARDVPKGVLPEVAVVIDVLRATTTMAWSLHNGAEAVQTFADLDELRISAAKWPENSRLLVGERGGKKLEGFDLGNSPVDVLPELVENKRIFMSTTNGTRSIDRLRETKSLYSAALVNRQAVVNQILKSRPEHLWIVGSGWEGTYSLEDSLAAGALVSLFLKLGMNSNCFANDEITAALSVWEYWKYDPEACLRAASHGKRLSGIGDHEADFKCCSELDVISVVPKQDEPGVFRAC